MSQALKRATLRRTSSDKPEADFRLRDYLGPGGRYPYKDLAADLEAAKAAGYVVYVFNVAGFMMLAGHPPDPTYILPDLTPWHTIDTDEYFATAREALAS